jgi:hypothetical protein
MTNLQFRLNFLIIFPIIAVSSCNSKNNSQAFQSITASLENASQTINRSSERIYHDLYEKTNDPCTVERARQWLPKAENVRTHSKNLVGFIEMIKSNIQKGEKVTSNDGEDLFKKIIEYRKRLDTIDERMTRDLKGSLIFIDRTFDSTEHTPQDFSKQFITFHSTEGTIAILSNIITNIEVNENKIIGYCNEQVSCMGFIFNSYSVLITQNSTVLKTNEIIEITAGVGAFSKAALPKISINGQIIALNENGTANYVYKAAKPGKFSIPVIIDYIDNVGIKQIVKKKVEYSVVNKPELEN